MSVLTAIHVQRAEQHIRREHDQFVAGVKLGTTYWTISPIHAGTDWSYDVHGQYRFTGPAGLGLPGQLRAHGGGTSWRIWRQHGPLTPVSQQTTASWNAQHTGSHAAAMRSAAEHVEADVMAELQRLYPATLEALAAA